ncbi:MULTISPECIES: flagellar filament capping protein FliD [unclassified Acidovorax]|jgi:flagellar hook-associated protein 2|uniref:flagellar filament capping protein FliD n=1 Tax=unclassified Acidovorax TaxID=2684926 RepID=UPI0008C87876|nr:MULTISPECIES: flagellar filament capping protein FliD [unclassified Acidovorax]MBV7462313.1 flagellar filament capping protein FliD [Acidovorax sp. sif0632]MBV7467594.1 flagellar filament capping protein FliD [Acidovorax sp. sif0613]OGA57827.1 MAG: flagellar cap protein FliD [Burkholderiales bacterium RIFCSPHIGHO2_01_FULL_64_960]
MATISSPGVGTNGLDVKSIISQLVTLEKRPLDTLKLQAATVNTKISAFGQIKSLVSTLQDAAGKLTSVTGWNGVATTSSDSKFVSATAVGGTLPTTFSVEVQSLAKAQATASAALLPVGGALGSGTLRLELGKWSVAPASFTPGSGQPVDITISASDKLSDVASKINGANAGVTASVLSDASGERLLLRSKSTGEEFGFRLSVMEDGDTDPQSAGNTDATGLSRLVNGATVTQAAADAKATVNGIAVSSATNTFASTISGVTFKAEQVTTAPIDITVSKDNSAIQSNIDGFVKAYNAINQLLQDATKYDAATKSAGLLQGDSTAVALQNSLRNAIQSVTTGGGAFQRLADIGITQQLGGDLAVDSSKLTKALSENPDDVKNLFRNTGGGAADGIAVQLKALTTNLLSNDGFFKSKDATLQLSLKRNSQDQTRVNEKVEAFEKRITQRYNALDTQLSSLNGLNAYISQQVTAWNKSTG